MKLALVALLCFGASAHAQSVVVFHEDFENGLTNWTTTGLWNEQEASESCTSAQVPFPSGTRCVWFGSPEGAGFACTFNASTSLPQYLTYEQPIVLPTTTGTLVLSYQNWANVENSFEWDMHGAEVRVFGATTWTKLKWSFNSNVWRLDTRDLTRWAGEAIELRFSFIPVDLWGNNLPGVLIDDVRIVEEPDVTLTFSACASDSTWYEQCPCSNAGAIGRGCASTLSATGAGLSGSGSTRLSTDSFALHIDGMSEAAATIFQASGFIYPTTSAIAGDGVSCVSGTFVRLVTRFAPGGALDFPSAADPAISVLGLVSPGDTRYYAARYRDSASFCSSATFNMSNTISAYWRP